MSNVPSPKGAVPSKPKKARTPRKSLEGAKIRAKPKTHPAAVAALYVSPFAIGDHISHAQFGEGTVIEIDVTKLTINFVSRGTKQIIDSYVERRTAA
jgi:hypothetical protein